MSKHIQFYGYRLRRYGIECGEMDIRSYLAPVIMSDIAVNFKRAVRTHHYELLLLRILLDSKASVSGFGAFQSTMGFGEISWSF